MTVELSGGRRRAGGRAAAAWGAALFAAGMVAMALGAHRGQLAAAKWGGAIAAVAGLVWILAAADDPLALLGLRRPLGRLATLGIPMAALGVAAACAYRSYHHLNPLPASLTIWALAAAGIGLAEEVAYRGFCQGALSRWGGAWAVILAAMAHAAYKTALLALPAMQHPTRLWPLAAWTLGIGVLLGTLRLRTANLLLPCIFHAVFDAAAYGDLQGLPWWTQ